ncbi:hypothetical protein ACWGI8_10960, partial [Streptomyces sp. NPDC054841]
MKQAQQLADHSREGMTARGRMGPPCVPAIRARGDGEEIHSGPAWRVLVHQLTSAPQAVELAEWLLAEDRPKPVIVVSIASGRTEPWIDVERLAAELRDLAELCLIPTGKVSWALAGRLPARTEVYGGAGRVYPVSLEWTSDPYRAPLRFAHSETDAARATDALVTDALALAAVGRPEVAYSLPRARVPAAVTRTGSTGTRSAAAPTDAVQPCQA